MHRSNGICLKTFEKHITKDFNYHMIIQRNSAHNSVTQISVLKAILKWRDYVARVEDESHHYIMPNYVLFSMSKVMPTTRNEFRECCRSNFTSIMLKYQDDIIKLVDKKIKSSKLKSQKKPNHHVSFDENTKPSMNPEYQQSILQPTQNKIETEGTIIIK